MSGLPDPKIRLRTTRLENGSKSIGHDTELSNGRTDVENDLEHRSNISSENGDPLESGIHCSTQDDGVFGQKVAREEVGRKVGIRERMGCYTWTWFTMTMATGGIANVLRAIPFRSDWLYDIGIFFMISNIVLFVTNCIMISLRFYLTPGSFRDSFTNQKESLFVPASIVSVGTILTNVCQYGIDKQGFWLQNTMVVLFWIYAGVSMLASSSIYLILWSTQAFPIHNMTPIWIFPAYPLLFIAPFASNLIDALPTAEAANLDNAVAIAFGALTLQGAGFLVSLNIYGAFIYRLMTQKLPSDALKPGMFVSVGPSGFTAAGFVHLGDAMLSKVLPNEFNGYRDGSIVLKLVLTLVGLWLWGLCIWFFLVSVGAHWEILWPRDDKHQLQFDMTWYSFVFPNTALVTATLAIGKTLESKAIQVVGTLMAGMLVVLWLFVFCMMIRAVVIKRLLWPVEESKNEKDIARCNYCFHSEQHGLT